MRVPYDLYWQPPQPATAILYPGAVEGLLRLCARLGGVDLPRIHATADGFLILLPRPSEERLAGVVRLRSLAEHVLIPVDAGLSPALLPDEASALGRQQGLVFLPGGRVLGFDPAHVLGPRDLLHLPRLPSRHWHPAPERARRPADLTGIVLEIPPEAEPDVLGPAGEQIGTQTPTAPQTGGVRNATGGILGGVGKGLDWLGQHLNSERLRQLGASLLRQAMHHAPQLTEKLLGKHESALRELLRRFREGNLDDALRHAVPLGTEPGRGGAVDDDPHLVARDFRWSSADLFPFSGGGRMWLSQSELFEELRRQYQKTADEALHQGDFLRAAAIHGKLLGDWRMAASLLERAGRHHDAARVYLDRLNDDVSAARAFEAAGEIDRAVALHEQHGRFLDAADLLRRVGEEERAMHYYLHAARAEADEGRYAAAARLLVNRAGAPHLAVPFLCQGWINRPSADANECLQDLMLLYLTHQREEPLWTLLDEADAHFAPPGDDAAAARFYNRLANQTPCRDDLRDRALRGLAGKLRQRAWEGDRGAGVVSLLFAQHGAWDAAVVRDAEFALRKASRPPLDQRRTAARWISVHSAEVRSVAQAADTGALVLGFADGCIACYDPIADHVSKITTQFDPVISLACSGDPGRVVLVRQQGEQFTLAAYEVQPDAWISTLKRPIPCLPGEQPRLTPMLFYRGEWLALGLFTDHYFKQLEGSSFSDGNILYLKQPIAAAFLLGEVWSSHPPTIVLALHPDGQMSASILVEHEWLYLSPSVPIAHCHEIEAGTRVAFLHWTQEDFSRCELAWCTRSGAVHWASIEVGTNGIRPIDSQIWPGEHCTCVALLDAGRLAAVHSRGITWLRTEGGTPRVQDRTEITILDAVAAFASPRTGELVVVTRGGDIVRVPLPG